MIQNTYRVKIIGENQQTYESQVEIPEDRENYEYSNVETTADDRQLITWFEIEQNFCQISVCDFYVLKVDRV